MPALLDYEILYALDLIFNNNFHADKALAFVFKKNKDLPKEPIARAVYEILRDWRFLWACRQESPATDQKGLQTVLRTWAMIQNPDERKPLEQNRIRQNSQSLDAIALSVPEWLYEQGLVEIGANWRSELAAQNEPANIVLRVNILKSSLAALIKETGLKGTTVDWAPEALVLHEHINAFMLPQFHLGHFEVQDAASQAVSLSLQVQPGMRVVDACAGNGGKSLHLAALMQNKGRIISLDISAGKLEELRRRARRSGAAIIETRAIESAKTIKRLYNSADRLLLDVPCTGTGVLRRNPDMRWRLTAAMLAELVQKQKLILQQYSRIVKINGLFAYSTCSLLPSEGEEQINWFLQQDAGAFSLQSEKRLSPARDRFDGFYIAVLKRER
jgi:16S rRNA (cytosine967-C5)-methyltransferase